MSCKNEEIDYRSTLMYISSHLHLFCNDLELFDDLMNYLAFATEQIKKTAMTCILDEPNGMIVSYIKSLYFLMKFRESGSDQDKVCQLIKHILAELCILNDETVIFIISKYYEEYRKKESELSDYLDEIMKVIIQFHKAILSDLLIYIYNGKTELDVNKAEIDDDEEEEEENNIEVENEEEENEENNDKSIESSFNIDFSDEKPVDINNEDKTLERYEKSKNKKGV